MNDERLGQDLRAALLRDDPVQDVPGWHRGPRYGGVNGGAARASKCATSVRAADPARVGGAT